MGLPPGPLAARFRIAPDLFFWPRAGGAVNLIYRYPDAKWLDAEGSRLDVSINGQFLKTLPLTGMSWWQKLWYGKGATNATARGSIGLPRYNLFGQNELVFDYSLLMADKKKCTGTLPDNVRVSLDPESTIDLTGAWHGLLMPDLASFAGAGYPFTVRPDLSETVVVMDEHPSDAAIEAFLNIMGRLGDSTGVAATGVSVVNNADPDRWANMTYWSSAAPLPPARSLPRHRSAMKTASCMWPSVRRCNMWKACWAGGTARPARMWKASSMPPRASTASWALKTP
jgi:cellulose synthase (UDP-forming)